MASLDFEVAGIKSNLLTIFSILNGLNKNDFKENISKINLLINVVSNKRNFLLSVYSPSELKSYNKELDYLTKLIKEKFDNIITEIEVKQKDILFALESTNNSKKLTNYVRN